MDLPKVREIVNQALELTNQSRSDATQIPISDSTILFGKDGYLDSMALVALLMDIEDALQENDINVSLSDERAMSQVRSPFKDVPSLAGYIHSLLSAQ